MDSSMYVRQSRIPLIGKLCSLLHGALYRHSSKGEEYMQELLEEARPFKCEIWTGSQDVDHQRPVFACNLSRAACALSLDRQDVREMNLYEPMYCDCDTETLCRLITSSYSIPSLLPSVTVGEHRLSDPGMVYGSPLHSFRKAISRMATEASVPVHLTILTTVDVYADRESFLYDGRPEVLSTLVNQALGAIQSNMAKDRMSCMDVMAFQGMIQRGTVTFEATPEAMKRLAAFKRCSSGTVTEIFCKNYAPVPLTSFDSRMLLEAVDEAGRSLVMRLHWFEKCTHRNLFKLSPVYQYRAGQDENLNWLISKGFQVEHYEGCSRS